MFNLVSIPKTISYVRYDNKDIEENTHIFNLLSVYQQFPNLSKNKTLTNFIIAEEWMNVIMQIAYNRRMKNMQYVHLPKICISCPLTNKPHDAKFGFRIMDEKEAEKINKDSLLDAIENAFNKDSWTFYYNQVKHLENCDLLTLDYNKEIIRMISVVHQSQKGINFPE